MYYWYKWMQVRPGGEAMGGFTGEEDQEEDEIRDNQQRQEDEVWYTNLLIGLEILVCLMLLTCVAMLGCNALDLFVSNGEFGDLQGFGERTFFFPSKLGKKIEIAIFIFLFKGKVCDFFSKKKTVRNDQ